MPRPIQIRDAYEDELCFTAKDAKDVAGITYRQISDWYSKGIMEADRSSDKGWRKFTPRQMFALVIIAELRKRHRLPLEELKFITDVMLREGTDHFRWSVHTIQKYGWTLYLLTDLVTTFVFDCDQNLQGLIDTGYLRRADFSTFILLHINPLVNKVLEAAGSHGIPPDEGFYERLRELEKKSFRFVGEDISERQREVLRLINASGNQDVTVHVRDGQIVRADREELVDLAEDASRDVDIHSSLENTDFGKLEVLKRNGRIVMLRRQTTKRLDEFEEEPDSSDWDSYNTILIHSGKNPESGHSSPKTGKESANALREGMQKGPG